MVLGEWVTILSIVIFLEIHSGERGDSRGLDESVSMSLSWLDLRDGGAVNRPAAGGLKALSGDKGSPFGSEGGSASVRMGIVGGGERGGCWWAMKSC